MTNEQIVCEIRNSYSATGYMQLLYESNLPLIKKFIKPFAPYKAENRTLQEKRTGVGAGIRQRVD